jgi:hypothetical protein
VATGARSCDRDTGAAAARGTKRRAVAGADKWPVVVGDDSSDPTKHRRGGAIGFDLSTVRETKERSVT